MHIHFDAVQASAWLAIVLGLLEIVRRIIKLSKDVLARFETLEENSKTALDKIKGFESRLDRVEEKMNDKNMLIDSLQTRSDRIEGEYKEKSILLARVEERIDLLTRFRLLGLTQEQMDNLSPTTPKE